MMSQQQRRIHDPIIDTIANSDDEKVEEIIASAGAQDQMDIAAPSQDGSMMGVFNGEPLCSSGTNPFKKMYNTGGSLAEAVEALSTSPIDSDALAPFGIDLDSMHNSPLPTRIKTVDHFSVSVPDCLPPHLMELDSPEPDLYEQEMQQSCEDFEMGESTKDINMSPEHLPASVLSEDQGISIQQAKTYIPSPGVSNGEEFDLNKEPAEATLDSEGLSASHLRISQMDTQLADKKQEYVPPPVTYSQSDIFASQPLTFGLEPKTVDLSPDNLETFDDDSRPELVEIRTSSKETSPFSMTKEVEYVSSKRKRDECSEEQKSVKKLTVEHPESSVPFDADNSPAPADDDIKILSDADQSVEVIYDKNLLQEKDSLQSQDIRLFLSSNTQSTESQLTQYDPYRIADNGLSKEHSEAPSSVSSPTSAAEPIYSCSSGTSNEIQQKTPTPTNSDEPIDENCYPPTKAIIKLPRFDTPSQLSEESGEVLFVNATKAARANISEAVLQTVEDCDSSPNYSSPANIMPVEKSVSSASPNKLREHEQQMQSTPLSSLTPSKKLFAPHVKPTPDRSRVLAEDSDDDAKQLTASGSVSSDNNHNFKENDTEVEFIMEKSEARNVLDLRNGKWSPVVTVVKTTITKWTHPESKEVLYSFQGDDAVCDGGSAMEKILSVNNLSHGSSRVSNISSFSGQTSEGYLADKSASASSYCASISLPDITRVECGRRSMASVISISPPKTMFKLPQTTYFNTSSTSTSTQTDGDTSPPAKPKTHRARGRPRVQKVQMPPPISETDEIDISTSETVSSIPVIVETHDEESEKTNLKPNLPLQSEIPPAKSAEITVKSDVIVPVPDPARFDNFLGQIQPSLREKLKGIHVSLSDEEMSVFMEERIKYMKSSDDIQNTIVRQRVREADIRPDMLVFARYNSDKNYYSAIIKAKDKEDRWKIAYNFDNQVSSVREIYILPTDLLPKSYPVYVLHPCKDFHEPGIVRGHVFNEGVLLHIIEIHGVTSSVPHSHLLLKEAHANVFLKARAAYRSLVGSPGGDLALDNILLRRTRGVTNSPRNPAATRKADPNFDTSGQEDGGAGSGVGRKSQKRSDLQITMEGSESSEFSGSPIRKRKLYLNSPRTPRSVNSPKSSRKKTPANSNPTSVEVPQPLNPVVGLNPLPELELPTETPPRKRGRKTTSRKTPKKTRKLNEDEPNGFYKKYGTIPPQNSTLFSGYSILITEMVHLDKLDKNITPSPMERKHLTQQIESGGGKVLPSFDIANLTMVQEAKKASKPKEAPHGQNYLGSLSTLEARDSPAKVLCVSNAPCRTAKFIQCLTVGIPIVSTSWVIMSCIKNQCLNWISHLLPAGKSLLTKTMMAQPFHDFDAERHSNVAKVVDVLKGDKVFLATSSEDSFKSTWMELLATAEAQVFTKTQSGKLNRLMDRKTSVVLADSTIPADELKRAEEIKAPVVSTEWFIQCIIQRCKVQYTAHPKFHYNYIHDDKCNDSDKSDTEDR